MDKSILYLGDTSLKGSGSYLAGIMSFYRIGFDYLPSDQAFSSALVDNCYQALIISDYPAGNFSSDHLNSIADQVGKGMGFLMIGGWESFTGANGEYLDTVLKEVLPVFMDDSDDRINCSQPCLIEKNCKQKIVDSLPFERTPPGIGGYNHIRCKSTGTTVLSARRFTVSCLQNKFTFIPFEQSDPLLVVGSFGKGRVCVFAGDVAPHWVGGLVDWGDQRLKAESPGANPIEVGNWYAELFANMIKWITAKL